MLLIEDLKVAAPHFGYGERSFFPGGPYEADMLITVDS